MLRLRKVWFAAALILPGLCQPSCARSSTQPTSTARAIPLLAGGELADWRAVPLTARDPQASTGISVDFGRLWVTNDEHSVLMRLEVGPELNLQDKNRIVLYLDTDDDPHTGLPMHGIGAELEWVFGSRGGRIFVDEDTISV